uniref:hypothetical protein n=1 Tax=Marinobacterium profundum TaxID=1714300 RepID=UPI00082A414F|nr:hypothetical protein [Marinobacterium profundum]
MTTGRNLAESLLAKGHILFIEKGRLYLESASSKPVPTDWLDENYLTLVDGILKQVGIDALIYESYSTGKYGPKMVPGVTLQFYRQLTQTNCYAIFNAELTRSRTGKSGKAGAPLPTGEFRLKKKAGFRKFWLSGLDEPRRWSDMHDRMGKLKGILFIGTQHSDPARKDRVKASTLVPLSLSHKQLLQVFGLSEATDKFPTTNRQIPDNLPTILPDKQLTQSPAPQAFKADFDTGTNCYGNTVNGSPVTRVRAFPSLTSSSIAEQAREEWVEDYCSADTI